MIERLKEALPSGSNLTPSLLPPALGKPHRSALIGAGFLGGIGFTTAIIVTFLAFGDAAIIQSSKLAILLGSLLAGTFGYMILRMQKGGD